ncbi:MAG: helix-turn-helix transcriptional regulator [Clostridia bacterium]|nr:helix-turn-helix transcriptional regulator [Clostridia bacterium]
MCVKNGNALFCFYKNVRKKRERTFLCNKKPKGEKHVDQPYLKELGKRLLLCRTQKDLSRKDLGILAGIPTATVLQMEQGEEVSLETIVKICKALHCSTDYLLTGALGIPEWTALQRKLAHLPEQSADNMQKIFQALWESCPKSVEKY